MAKAYEAKAAEFKAKYGIELDIGAMYDFNKKASYLDDFVFNTNPQEKGRKLHMDTLVQALSDRIERISKIQTGSLYMTLNDVRHSVYCICVKSVLIRQQSYAVKCSVKYAVAVYYK